MVRAEHKGASHFVVDHDDTLVSSMDVDRIDANRWQPRSVFDDDALRELASSIREVGVLQPLVVRPKSAGRYELIAGERRLRAAKLAGLRRIPVVVRIVSDRSALEMALIENVQRADIGPLECARAYRQLMTEFGLTQEQVADKVGKARTSVANAVRMLKLSPKIQDGLETGRISEGHARALLAFEHEDHRLAVYDQVLTRSLSVRDVEGLAARISRKSRPSKRRPDRGSEWSSLEESLAMQLGAPVTLQQSETGGRLIIEFFSDEDLERILEHLSVGENNRERRERREKGEPANEA